ncbi:TonB-dependent receptor plug domain-containing protein [Steroidobacter sp.]|uniref:TonB-dependent receptor plug domain-containing protein n=1 Tax=Steroidobacter sp. TaxID=1978227 RepID=UPI001A4436DA|nr:TonB-dependent receptor [Steroidobacter sp.]MBL8268532.1 TonB-dependent receptor [Steroidobacter sp.]
MKALRRLACLTAGLAVCHPALAQLQGRNVTDILNGLRAEGLIFIYNTQIVPDDLKVTREPQATRGIEVARQILAEHDLAVSEAAPRVYAVVRDPRARQRITTQPSPSGETEPAEEIVVQTSRYTLAVDTATPKDFLTQDQVQAMPRLGDETLRAMQRLPGVATNGVSSLGSVRGGEPKEAAIVLNGLRLYEPFHLKNFNSPISLLDSRIIDSIEYYSGGFAAPFGDRMSAIIDATSILPLQRYYEVGLSFFHFNALAATPFAGGRGHALLSARRSNIGDLAQFSEQDFGEPNYADGFAHTDYQLNDATRVSLDVLVSGDQFNAKRHQGTQRVKTKYQNLYSWLTLNHDWTDNASTNVIASFTDLDNRRRGQVNEPGLRRGEVWDDRSFHIAGLRLENSLRTGAIEHRFGGEVRRLWGDYDYRLDLMQASNVPFPGSPPLQTSRATSASPGGYENSAYWDSQTTLSSRWTIEAGLRVDLQTYDGTGDDEQWSPRFSALYTLSPRTKFRASWGRFFQSQGINELQVEDGVDQFYPAQHADHTIVSVEHLLDVGLDIRVEAYRKQYRHVSPRFENVFDPLALFPEAEFDRIRIDPDSARAEGVEILLQMRPRNSWSGWLSYTWAQVDDRIGGADVARGWDQRHALTLGVTWASGPWTATLVNSFHSGWPTTQLAVTSQAGGGPTMDLSARNSTRFDNYNSLDIRVTRTFLLSRGALDVFAEVTNALSRKNPCCVEYTIAQNEDGTPNYVREVNSWLPPVPSLGVLWRY